MKNATLLALFSLVVSACSSAPVIPIAPSVKVSELESVLITPDFIRYRAKVVINNQMRGKLNVAKVDYEVDLHDNSIVNESFDRLKPMRARGQQTVTLPFEIPMKDIMNQAVDVLAEEAVRVNFRGAVHPVGFDPVPFEATRTIPLPKIPTVSIAGVDGTPLEGEFTVFLGVKNNNDFNMTLQSVDSFLTLNGKKYKLLGSEKVSRMAPGQTGKVALTMRQTMGKGISMAWNVIKSKGSTNFEIGGSFSCQTPHGLIQVPLKLSSEG